MPSTLDWLLSENFGGILTMQEKYKKEATAIRAILFMLFGWNLTMFVINSVVWASTGEQGNVMWYMLFLILSLGFAGNLSDKTI
jgi:hypothetical protein